MSGAGTRIAAVVMNDLRILRRDPAFVVIFTLMPLAFMAFTKGAFAAGLALKYPGRGSTVPSRWCRARRWCSAASRRHLGFAIFREHSWATWDRLRASQLSTVELMAGKAVGPVLVLALQLTVMLGGGAVLFGLNLTGSLVAFVLVAVALAVMEVSLGFMLLAICRSVLQLNAVTNLGAMMLGGSGCGDAAVPPADLGADDRSAHTGVLGHVGVHEGHDRWRRHRRRGSARARAAGLLGRVPGNRGVAVPHRGRQDRVGVVARRVSRRRGAVRWCAR